MSRQHATLSGQLQKCSAADATRVRASAKLQAHHLDRLAIVYVRQSSPQQVLDHKESTARQYALVDLAVELGWAPDRIAARVSELLTLVGLDPGEFAGRYPRALSGGQRQRVGVARALAADPALLLRDEPFGALDPITRVELQREFRALEGRLGKGMVFVTHDVREGLLLGTKLGLMHEGRLAFLGTPEEFRRSNDPQVKQFMEAA